MLQLRDQQQDITTSNSQRGSGSLRQKQQNKASGLNNSFPVQQPQNNSSLHHQNRSFNSAANSGGGFKPTNFIKKRNGAPLNRTTTTSHQQISSQPQRGAQSNYINNSREFGRQTNQQTQYVSVQNAASNSTNQQQEPQQSSATMLLYKPGQAQQQLQSLKSSFQSTHGQVALRREASGEVEYRSEPNLRGVERIYQQPPSGKFEQEIGGQNAPYYQEKNHQQNSKNILPSAQSSNIRNYHSLTTATDQQINKGGSGSTPPMQSGFPISSTEYATNPTSNPKYVSPKGVPITSGSQSLRSGALKKSPTANTFSLLNQQVSNQSNLPLLGDVRYMNINQERRVVKNQTPLAHQTALGRPPIAQYQSVPVVRQNPAKNSDALYAQSLAGRFYPAQNDQSHNQIKDNNAMVSYIGGPAVEESPESVFDQDEDEAFREMEQLLAELDQDVTDLKKRNFFSKQRSSQGPPVQRSSYRTGSQQASGRGDLTQGGQDLIGQKFPAKMDIKSSSLSPSKSRSNQNDRSDNSSSQRRLLLQQSNLSDKNQNSPQRERDQGGVGSKSQPQIVVVGAGEATSSHHNESQKSNQFTSPTNLVESPAQQLLQGLPPNTATMTNNNINQSETGQNNDNSQNSSQNQNQEHQSSSLRPPTEVNQDQLLANNENDKNIEGQDRQTATTTQSKQQKKQERQHQERLFRLSPLSSKMQEGSDNGDDNDMNESEQNRQVFPLNSSINSQNESPSASQNNSPHHQQRHHANAMIQPSTRQALPNTQISSSHQRLFEDDRGGEAPQIVEDRIQPVLDQEPPAATTDSHQPQTTSRQMLEQEQERRQQTLLGSQNQNEQNDPLEMNILRDSQVYIGDQNQTGEMDQENSSGSPIFTNGEQHSSVFVADQNTRNSSPINHTRSQNQSVVAQAQMINAQCQTEELLAGGQLDLANQTQVLVQQPSDLIDKTWQEQETQTRRQDFNQIKLSPFDTYDLYFVKDLVNDLHKDNEVLNDSNQDLKHAFRYLLERHKRLQGDLEKEQQKTELLASTRKRLISVAEERDQCKEESRALKQKLNVLKQVIVASVQEQQHVEQEAWGLVDQLQEENRQLRNLMSIGEEASKPATVTEIDEQISALEKRTAEAKYKADMQERQIDEAEKQRDLDKAKEEISIRVEKEYSEKFDQRFEELEAQYKQQMEKAEQETALLKKTLLEQSLQRLNQLKNSSQDPENAQVNPSDKESSSLEGSSSGGPSVVAALKSKSQNAAKSSTKLQQNEQELIQKMLQTSGLSSDLSSSENNDRNNLTSSMQQELVEFAQNFDTWNDEEQELIQALKYRESQISGNKRAGEGIDDDKDDEKMNLEDLESGMTKMNDDDDNLNDRISDEEDIENESDEEDIDFEDFHERFGDMDHSPTLEEKQQAAGTKIQVITKKSSSSTPNTNQNQSSPNNLNSTNPATSAQIQTDELLSDEEEEIIDEIEQEYDTQQDRHHDHLDDQFATQSFANNTKNGAQKESNEAEENLASFDGQPEKEGGQDAWEYGGALSDEFFGNQSSSAQNQPNQDTDDAMFDEETSEALKEVKRQEKLRERYEEYFASEETDLIEKELMAAADESASDHSDTDEADKLSPRSFEKAHSAQTTSILSGNEDNSEQNVKDNEDISEHAAHAQDLKSKAESQKSINPNAWTKQRKPISRKKQVKSVQKSSQKPQSEQITTSEQNQHSSLEENEAKSVSNDIIQPDSTQQPTNKYKRVKKDKKEANANNQRSAGSSSGSLNSSQSPSPSPSIADQNSNHLSTEDQSSKQSQETTSQFQNVGNQEPQQIAKDEISPDNQQESLSKKEADQKDDLQNLFETMENLDSQDTKKVDSAKQDDFAFDPSQVVSGSINGQEPIDFDFGDDFTIPKSSETAENDQLFGNELNNNGSSNNQGAASVGGRYADFFDDGFANDQDNDDDYQFYQELSQGFTSNNTNQNSSHSNQNAEGLPSRENEQAFFDGDDTSALRQMMLEAKKEQNGLSGGAVDDQNEDQEEIVQNDQFDNAALFFDDENDDLEREEAKEEEYDYFLDAIKDENAGNAGAYHVIDEDDLKDDDEYDEEDADCWLDEETKRERHNNMLGDFAKQLQREDEAAKFRQKRKK